MNLREHRNKLSLSPEYVANHIGISLTTLQRCERLEKMPENRLSREKLMKLYGINDEPASATGAKE